MEFLIFLTLKWMLWSMFKCMLILCYQDRPQGWPVIWSSTCATHEWGKNKSIKEKQAHKGGIKCYFKPYVLSIYLRMLRHQWKWTIKTLFNKNKHSSRKNRILRLIYLRWTENVQHKENKCFQKYSNLFWASKAKCDYNGNKLG